VHRGFARLVRTAGAILDAAGCGALAACGGHSARTGTAAVTAPPFPANAAGLIAQLHADLVVGSQQVAGLRSARQALHNESDLMALLIAYDDFGSCSAMVRNAGTAGTRFARVVTTLTSACRYLERASQLFGTAASRSDAGALLAASRTTLLASPLLFRATAELVAADARRG
jgi:hypothetical protein